MVHQRQQEVARAAEQIEYQRARILQLNRHPLHRARAPPPVEIERQQVVQQVVASRDAPEHLAHPMCGRLLAGDPARRRAGHAKTASMESSTRRSSSPVTMRTSPIFTGRTKCTLPCTVFLSALG